MHNLKVRKKIMPQKMAQHPPPHLPARHPKNNGCMVLEQKDATQI